MEKLIEFFITNVGTDKVWIGFLFLAIYYIVRKEPFKVFAHFSEKREKQHELAVSLLELDKLGELANGFLREHLERAAFQKYYGISASSAMRHALIKFQEEHESKIGWHDIKRAYSSIKRDGLRIHATLGWFDHLMRWLVTGMCWLVGFYALLVIALAMSNGSNSKIEFVGLTFAALLLFATTLAFSSLNWPYHSTRKVIGAARNKGC